jgi:hypothetical protein
MKPTDTAIAALEKMGLSSVIPKLEYSQWSKVWFFLYRDMLFAVEPEGKIRLFAIEE